MAKSIDILFPIRVAMREYFDVVYLTTTEAGTGAKVYLYASEVDGEVFGKQ